LAALKELGAELDNFQRFRLQIALDFFQKVTEVTRDGTALYEKLILLNGATIALSITFLGYLSSRLAIVHITEKPHLWMVAIAWSLLIASIFCCYHVIVARHTAVHGRAYSSAEIQKLIVVSPKHEQPVCRLKDSACWETIRKVKTLCAHDIRFADVSQIALVRQRNDSLG